MWSNWSLSDSFISNNVCFGICRLGNPNWGTFAMIQNLFSSKYHEVVISNNLGGMPLGWTEIYPTIMNEEFAIELPRKKADYNVIRILVTYNGASCSLSTD